MCQMTSTVYILMVLSECLLAVWSRTKSNSTHLYFQQAYLGKHHDQCGHSLEHSLNCMSKREKYPLTVRWLIPTLFLYAHSFDFSILSLGTW